MTRKKLQIASLILMVLVLLQAAGPLPGTAAPAGANASYGKLF